MYLIIFYFLRQYFVCMYICMYVGILLLEYIEKNSRKKKNNKYFNKHLLSAFNMIVLKGYRILYI